MTRATKVASKTHYGTVAEHDPLDGAEILLGDSTNKVEDEDGEGDAGVGAVEGELDLGVPGECVI
ncbi:hypothetical protein FH972_001795 [Carpinus fangiana]|uniref:Uncharacterized protein n=1 Tax=Carpinus fangiana TaxID=176857 RepID=A0A5N6QEP9_9ROSI|nr:hypothetical protein FH972_001795 [Carpinus fangiana]